MPNDNFAHDPRIKEFWQKQREKVDSMSNAEYRQLTKTQILPLARIKKIMKIEDEMISGEGPILIAKASEFLIEELTLHAWLHAESHRRKTLQKIDIANATLQNDMFDFLIDIVPRPGQQESNGPVPIRPRPTPGSSSSATTTENTTNEPSTNAEEQSQPSTSTFAIDSQNNQQIQYFVQCAPEMMQNEGDGESNGYSSAPHIIYCDPSTLNGVGGSLVTLEDGRILEAMPIGQPIPLSGPNQPIQVMTVANGAPMQFVPIQSDNE